MDKKYYITIMGIGINIDHMEYQKNYNTVWLYLEGKLVTHVMVNRYVIKHTFNGNDEEGNKVQYFTIIRK